VEVPIRLARREEALPADAFLLFADGPVPLAAACERFAELPEVFPVRGGFLLVPRGGGLHPAPAAIRLRRLSGDLFIPADADLLPSLLPDEAAALTRERGLVALPGGTVLAFDAGSPLPVSRWLAPARVRRAEWKPFPRRPERPDSLSVIERPSPPVAAVVELLVAGAPGDAKPLPGPGEGAGGVVPDELRPTGGSALARAAAGAGLAAAGFLAWLGRQLGAGGLARLGGNLARRALELAPRISERLLGEQEAALRDVLRELQGGDVEKGLRHAPPAVADPDQPARIGTGSQLSARDPRYSLRDLIASGGVATAWLGGGDVWAQLASEYRRLAAEAAARGDHRRAAYLYGVLLRDLRAAANALLAGGHYRDAALLFRDRLKDPGAAAEAFDRAGDHDEALRLYDRLGAFEQAGDLLRRIGEEGRAVQQYFRAAAKLASARRFLAAGDLMRAKARRCDAAGAWYRAGWEGGGAESLTCAERLLDEALVARDRPAVRGLWAEAESALADRPRDAGRFFNYALRVAADFLPDEDRADLADRARLLFAAQLRAGATIGETGALVGVLLPAGEVWAPPVGRDAAFAVRSRRPEPRPEADESPEGLVQVARGPVTAAVVVRDTLDVVVAAQDGVACWRVSEGRVQRVWKGGERVAALSVSARGEVVFAVALGADDKWRIRAFTAPWSGEFWPTTQYVLSTGGGDNPAIYLQPAAVFRGGEHRVAVSTPVEHYRFAGPYLQTDTFQPPEPGAPVRLLVDTADGHSWSWLGESVRHRGPDEGAADRWHVPWMATERVDSLTPAPGVLEIVAVDVGGRLHWAEFDARNPKQLHHRSAFATHPKGYATACLVAPGVVAAATNENEVRWFNVAGGKLIVSVARPIRHPARVFALAPRPDASEVAAILADGHALRVGRP
jgi:hypothetical protein